MMTSRTHRHPNAFMTLLLALGLASTAQATPVTLSGTWYAVNGEGTNTVSIITGDADTILVSQPALATGSGNRGAVTTFGSSYSLANVGDFLQFTGDYSGSVGNNINHAIRIGFYNTNGSTVTADFSAASDDWIGLFAASGNRSTAGASSNNFYHPSDANTVLQLANESTPPNSIGTAATNVSTGSRTITFRVERTSPTDLSLRLISGSVDHTDTLAVATAPTTTFNALAVSFRIGNTSSTTTGQFDNISVTTIPEPGTLALMGLALVTLVLCRRRR